MRSPSAIIAVSALLWVCAGCESKRLKEPLPLAKLPELAYPVVLPPPDSAPMPTITAENIPVIPSPTTAPKPAKNRPRSKPPKTITDKPTTGPTNSASQPTTEPANQKVVISPSAESSQSIAASLPHTDELHHRQTTAQLLESTENNLRLAGNSLSAQQQDLIAQIRNFLAQARQAQTDNDQVRAHNLALKAHLLSDELVRR